MRAGRTAGYFLGSIKGPGLAPFLTRARLGLHQGEKKSLIYCDLLQPSPAAFALSAIAESCNHGLDEQC